MLSQAADLAEGMEHPLCAAPAHQCPGHAHDVPHLPMEASSSLPPPPGIRTPEMYKKLLIYGYFDFDLCSSPQQRTGARSRAGTEPGEQSWAGQSGDAAVPATSSSPSSPEHLTQTPHCFLHSLLPSSTAQEQTWWQEQGRNGTRENNPNHPPVTQDRDGSSIRALHCCSQQEKQNKTLHSSTLNLP